MEHRVLLPSVLSLDLGELQLPDISGHRGLRHVVALLIQVLCQLLLSLNVVFSNQLHNFAVTFQFHVLSPLLFICLKSASSDLSDFLKTIPFSGGSA